MANVIDFLLNKGASGDAQVVDAPAFSLTKVLGSAATIIAPLSALLANWLTDANLNAGDYVALTLGLLAFLAITASADVLARAWATAGAADKSASEAGLIPFKAPLAGRRIKDGEDAHIKVLAAANRREGPVFLVAEADGSLAWWPTPQITFS
jgi:hypothetical protein